MAPRSRSWPISRKTRNGRGPAKAAAQLIPHGTRKNQTQILAKLEEWGRITAEQRTEIIARHEDFSGEALDKLLQDDYKIPPFQCSPPRPARSASRPTMWTRTG